MSEKVTLVCAKPSEVVNFGDVIIVIEEDGSESLYMLCLVGKDEMVAIDLKTGNRFCSPKECDSGVILEEGIPLSDIARVFSGDSTWHTWSKVIKPKEIRVIERGAEE